MYNTVSDNAGCGIEIEGLNVLLRGNIISGNDMGIELQGTGSAVLEYNDVWNNTVDYEGALPGFTDFSIDPIFITNSLGKYFLSQIAAGELVDSPCLDAGDNNTEPSGYTRTDLVPDSNIVDTGFHRTSNVSSPVPTWTPTPNSSPPPGSPTPTPNQPTNTPPSGVILVPEHYTTIQDAIDAAHSGDIVNVAPGTYMSDGNRDISFEGKDIIVESRNGPDVTIIDCGGSFGNPHRAFIFNHNEPQSAILRGFTIQNGFEIEGGAIWVYGGADPLIQNCRIKDCTATSYGGGVYADNSNMILENSELMDCFASDGGGGIMISGEESISTVIYKTILSNNNSSAHVGGGGGICIRDSAKPYLTSCVFINNQSIAVVVNTDNTHSIEIANCLFTNNQGAVEVRMGNVDVINCTFTENTCFAVEGNPSDGTVNILRSCLWGPEDAAFNVNGATYSNLPGGNQDQGNFYSDPLFITGHFGDYYLMQNSAGDPFSPNVNRGGAPAFEVSFKGPYYRIGLTELTTAEDETRDSRFSDIGYHYYPSNLGSTPTPEPTHGRPIIEDVLGSTEHFDKTSETYMLISAHVDHPFGNDYIDSVELYLDDNIPLQFYLNDDNNDGRYTTELYFTTADSPLGQFHLNIVAFGKDGSPSEMAPYEIQFNEDPVHVKPEIDGKHFWFSMLEAGKNEMGFLWILTRVSHDYGIDHIDKVQLLCEDVPTGIELYDDGLHQDLAAHDGYYGIMILYNGAQIPEPVEVVLGIQAIDKEGEKSHIWPMAWKAQ